MHENKSQTCYVVDSELMSTECQWPEKMLLCQWQTLQSLKSQHHKSTLFKLAKQQLQKSCWLFHLPNNNQVIRLQTWIHYHQRNNHISNLHTVNMNKYTWNRFATSEGGTTHARTHARTHACTHAHTHARTHARTQPFCSSLDFVWDNLGELVPEGTFRHLLDFLVQNEDNTGRHTNNLDGLPPHPH